MKGLFLCLATLVVVWCLSLSTASQVWAVTCENGGLQTTGADLGARYVDPNAMEVNCLQWLGDVQVSATHVVAKFPDGSVHTRDAAGVWSPWDGNVDSLPDTGARVDGDKLLRIHVFTGEANPRGFPIEATVYRRLANGALQFGALDIFPDTMQPGGGQ